MKTIISILISIIVALPCFPQQVLPLAFPDEITFSGEIAYLQGSPFTGKLIDNKTKKEIGEFKSGYKNGLFTVYYVNGKKMAQGKYTLGKKDGLHTNWYENGNKKDENSYDNNELNGVSKEWFSNSQLKYSGGYILGEKDGLQTSWYDNGCKKDEATYKDRVLNGSFKEWYPNGLLKVEYRYYSGQIVDGKYYVYSDNGQKEKVETYSKGIKLSEGFYKDGFLYEQSILYYVNGIKKAEGTLKNGLRDGIWAEWYKTGEKKKEEKFENGNRTSLIFEETKLVTDIDDNVYHTISIGNQVWMIENLKTTKYRNGDLIGTTTPATLYLSEGSYSKYQWAYAGNESNVATYGRLYTWYAATDSRNVCPTGWHVPTDAEWTTLTTFLGGENIAGGKLKETGTNHWPTPNNIATNSSGFTALPGGLRYYDGTFLSIGSTLDSRGSWWSSSEWISTWSTGDAWYICVYHNNLGNVRGHYTKSGGFSVRCIKD